MYVTTFPCHNCASLRNPMSLYNYIDMEKAAFKQYAEETAIIRKGKEDE